MSASQGNNSKLASSADERRKKILEAKRQAARQNPLRIFKTTIDGLDVECRGSHQQDLFVYEVFFPGVKNGTFFECGALDGAYLSNTNIFERYFEWTGVLVEPITSQYEKLAVNRPNSKAYNACVGPSDTNVLFFNLRDGGLSGIVKEIGRKQIEKYEFSYNNSPESYAKRPDMLKLEWKPVIQTTRTLIENGFKHINFFSLDVEGGEASVLRGLDFEQITVDVFCIEANASSKAEVEAILIPRGFRPVAAMGQDIFYVSQVFLDKLTDEGVNLVDRMKASRVHSTSLI